MLVLISPPSPTMHAISCLLLWLHSHYTHHLVFSHFVCFGSNMLTCVLISLENSLYLRQLTMGKQVALTTTTTRVYRWCNQVSLRWTYFNKLSKIGLGGFFSLLHWKPFCLPYNLDRRGGYNNFAHSVRKIRLRSLFDAVRGNSGNMATPRTCRQHDHVIKYLHMEWSRIHGLYWDIHHDAQESCHNFMLATFNRLFTSNVVGITNFRRVK